MKIDLEKSLQRASKIKLTGGLVGRVCSVVLAACIALGAIGVASRNEYIMGGALASILLLALPLLWRVISFAEKNPAVAILDGAQFLKHEQLELASKQQSVITVIAESQVQERPTQLLPEQAAVIDRNEEVPSLPNSDSDSRKG